MFSTRILALALLSALLLLLPPTCSTPLADRAAGSVCSSGVYGALLFLESYPPAESFCSAHYPPAKVTTTITSGKCRKRDAAAMPAEITVVATITAKAKLDIRGTSCDSTCASGSTTAMSADGCVVCSATTNPTTTTTSTTKPTTSCDAACQQWKTLSSVGGGLLSTFCSCIESHSTVRVRTSPSSAVLCLANKNTSEHSM